MSLAIDTAGNLFVGDRGSSMIFKFTPDGTQSTFASQVLGLLGMAFDRSGNLFVSDDSSNKIFKFTPDGTKTSATGFVNSPAGIAFDNFGNLFVCLSSSGGVTKFAPDGTETVFASGLSSPFELAFDNSGNLFIAELGSNISKFTPDGTKSTFTSAVSSPHGLAFEPTPRQLRNISTRGFVSTGDGVLIGGFVVGGNGVATNSVLVRAIGPSLTALGVTGALQDPALRIFSSSGAVIASNDNWKDTQQSQIQATGLAPADDHESALLLTLPAGSYTAIVTGANATTGIGLVEVFGRN